MTAIKAHRPASFFLIAILICWAITLTSCKGVADELYADIIGSPAPEWNVLDWVNAEPMMLEGLRGRVVLVRWWTGPGCQFCSASVPILNGLYARYQSEGLVVVGFYHNKSSPPLSFPQVKRVAEFMGFGFPLAVDPGWNTLKRYWLDRVPEGAWTSASFLIDKQGIIRYIHPGGVITEEDGRRLEEEIVRLLRK